MALEPLEEGTPLSVGRLLRDSLTVYRANFVSFTLVVALAYAPLFLWMRFGGEIVAGGTRGTPMMFWVVALALFLFTPFISQGALVFGAVEYMRGRRVGVGEAIGRGVQVLLPVLGVALLGGLATVAPVAIGAFVGALLGPMILLTLLIGGMFSLRFMTNFWVAVPAAVFEKQGVIESLKRSNWLVTGSRMGIFGMWLVLFVTDQFANAIWGRILPPESLAVLVAALVISVLVGAVQAVSSAVAYSQLRESREGVDATELAEIFR